MIEDIQLSIVRIYKLRKNKNDEIRIVGAGFLVSEEYIITCAHVVNQSIEEDVTSTKKPTEIIECDFPLISPVTSLETTVEMWKPVKFNSNDPQDIAVLKLKNKDLKPPKAQPSRLISHQNIRIDGHQFEAFGFPNDLGIWADGEIKKGIAYNKIQIEGKTVTGERLQAGFSGTAIWDKELQGVVGIAAIEHDNPEAKIAFFIPVYMLLRAFPELLDTPTIKINGYIPEIIILLKNNYTELEKELNLAYQNLLSDVGFELVRSSLPTEILLSNLTELIDILEQQVSLITTESQLKVTRLQILIGYLILEIKQGKSYRNELNQWLQKYLKNDWESLVRLLELKREQKRTNLSGGTEQEKEPCLLVSVTKENNGLRLRSWIIEDVKHYDPTQESPQKRNYCKSLQSNEGIIIKNLEQQFFVQYLKDVYQEAFNLCQCSINKIQIFFPYKLIEKEIEPIDLLTIDKNPSFAPPPMGKKYEVIVRFSERLKTTLDQESLLWQNKCKKLKEKKGKIVATITEICGFCDSEPFELYKKIMPENIIGARLEILQESHRENVMEAFYYAGIPLAIWVREAENFECQETLENICHQCNLENLSAHLKEKRRTDWRKPNHIGNHLSLLWDDYQLVPPNYPLLMP
jgi:hypothetical protein